MKKIILSSLLSMITLVLLSLISAIVVSYLQYNQGMKINMYVIQAISILFFLLSGMVYGFINKKQGLLGSFVFILVYLIFILIFDVFTKSHEVPKLYFLFILGKCVAYSMGAIISVNLKRH